MTSNNHDYFRQLEYMFKTKSLATIIRKCFSASLTTYHFPLRPGLTACNKYIFTESTSHPLPNNEEEERMGEEADLIGVEVLAGCIRQDIGSNYRRYHLIKSSFKQHLQHNRFSRSNQEQLVEILELLSNYPAFQLSNPQMLSIYAITCHNLHLKSVPHLNSILKFVLVADENVSQSPIYLQFVRFYLQLSREYLKVKYQIDFQRLSVWEAAKQFVGRIVQRGFLPRSPQYQRNLNVLDHEQVLYRLVGRKDTRQALMIKKLNYTIFMDFKEFYEEQMKENLYHWKKAELMPKFTYKYMRVLADDLPQIHPQSTHLRQLYMKLYLTLPEHPVQTNTPHQVTNDWPSQIEVLKIKNVIYLYNLAQRHIERINHCNLEEISENIGIVIEFVQAVEHNLVSAASKVGELRQYGLEFDEALLIMQVLTKLELERSLLFSCLLGRVKQLVNPLVYSSHFALVLSLLQKQQQQLGSLMWLFQQAELLSLLSLEELHSLGKLSGEFPSQLQLTVYAKLLRTIVSSILSRDFEVIGAKEMGIFLDIYKQSIKCQQHTQEDIQTLRKFAMRYISDHYQQFTISDLETLLNQLLDLPHQSCNHFQDLHGNYSNSIFQELQSYLEKIHILLSSQTTLKLSRRKAANHLQDSETARQR